MGNRFLFRVTAFAVAMAIVVLGAGVAWADWVENDVTTQNETVSISNGGSASVGFHIKNQNTNAGDTINSCNPADGTAATVTINAPSGVTATPTSLSFTRCDEPKYVAFTSTTAGNHSITVSVTDSGGGVYNTGGAAFTLSVAAPACTVASVTNPANQSITYGADASFSVTPGGSPAPTLQWQSRSSSSATWTDIPDATSSTLNLTKPGVSASGSEYRAVATNSCGGTKTATSSAATLTVAARPIEVSADAQSKTYGDSDPTLTYSVTSGSLVTGDSFSGDLTRDAGENVGDYAITQGTLTAGGNYDLTYNGAKLTINKRSIGVTADTQSKVWGEADPPLTYQVTTGSLVTGDAFTGSLARAAGESVGTYAINQGTLTAGGNYNVSFVGANLTITPKYTTRGFFSPVDMNGVYNTVKNGATVPLKFELFEGDNEVMVTSAVKGLTHTAISCESGAGDDAVETTATGSTSLRYDSTAGQFVYNWKTPSQAGKCFKVTVEAEDGTKISALFKLK